ncbi:hypothetical protein LSH36_330g02035 [Paralvinella palmiformis]|uniref:Prefoldin subunit 6 n=1 Tax=Paralvinella palmiformis TaxID=53620 RepID=A0AAD9N096_9ANNE|nr:hypothetical protein LSH36_330g02035 [Paralvinella palmiformis]
MKCRGSYGEYQKCLSTRQQLDAQLNENGLVKDELVRLEEGATVYKMIGPVLVKQDQDEAKQTVQKRIDYISEQLKKHDCLIKDLEKKQDSHRENLQKLQHQFQQSQVKAATRA